MISACFAIFLFGSQACNADIFVIDPFTTGTQYKGETGNGQQAFGDMFLVNAGDISGWYDTGDMAGGRRDVTFGVRKGSSNLTDSFGIVVADTSFG